MNIPKILRPAGIVVALGYPILMIQRSCDNQIIKELKSEVCSKDSVRYKEIEKRSEARGFFAEKALWIQENKAIDDSLKMDSIAKKSYFEGAQMVRDSINEKERIVGGK